MLVNSEDYFKTVGQPLLRGAPLGLTSGTELALRVVERYFGREVAQTTATYMEYLGKSWIV